VIHPPTFDERKATFPGTARSSFLQRGLLGYQEVKHNSHVNHAPLVKTGGETGCVSEINGAMNESVRCLM
jgi:hypothetical protein